MVWRVVRPRIGREPPSSLPVIVLDPGHGGGDPGAIGPGGTYEKHVNLAIALAVAQILAGPTLPVLTRRTDTAMSLAERAGLANTRRATVFLSIHANGSEHPHASGTETFHYPGSIRGAALASLVQQRLVAIIGRVDRGVKAADFHVLRETHCPATLAEVAFLTNPEEARLLTDPRFQRRAGAALARAIVDYLRRR
jgi:N-acetylmuramoyl-L-alanine amidase